MMGILLQSNIAVNLHSVDQLLNDTKGGSKNRAVKHNHSLF